MDTQSEFLKYRPSAFYYREAARETNDPEKLREIAMAVISESETLRAWVRDQGLIPPKWTVHRKEADAKGWGLKN